MTVKLNKEKLRYISLFEELTGATPKDCVETGEENSHITFVINESDMGKAIGQDGRNIKKVRREFDKRIDVVEYSGDPVEFLKNIFSSVEIHDIDIEENEDGEKSAIIDVEGTEKGRAVGKNGWNINRARKLLSRHHGMSDVSLT